MSRISLKEDGQLQRIRYCVDDLNELALVKNENMFEKISPYKSGNLKWSLKQMKVSVERTLQR